MLEHGERKNIPAKMVQQQQQRTQRDIVYELLSKRAA